MARIRPQRTLLSTRRQQYPQTTRISPTFRTEQKEPTFQDTPLSQLSPEQQRTLGKQLAKTQKQLGIQRESLQYQIQKRSDRIADGKTNNQYYDKRIEDIKKEIARLENEIQGQQRELGETYNVAIGQAPRDFNAEKMIGLYGQTGKSDRATVSQAFKQPGIYTLSTGETIITQAGTGSYINPRGQTIRIQEGRKGKNFPVPLQTQTASVSSPELKSSPDIRQPGGASLGTGVTAGVIGNLVGTSPELRAEQEQIRKEQELTTLIGQVQEREQAQAQRIQDTRDFFRAIPGLRGDNFAQRTTRIALAQPTVLTAGLGGTIGSVIDRSRIVAKSFDINREGTIRELRGATREVPGAIGTAFDPRTPEGLVNLGTGFLIGRATIKQSFKSPVIASTKGGSVTRASTITGSTTEIVPLRGVFNIKPIDSVRSLSLQRRTGTLVTRQTSTGKITQTLSVKSPVLGRTTRLTDTFTPGATGITRTVSSGGRSRRFELRSRKPLERPIRFEELEKRSVTDSTLRAENIQKNILRQELTTVQEVDALAISQGGRPTPGRLRSVERVKSVSELPPSEITVKTLLSDLRTGKTQLQASQEAFVTRPLRPGAKTSKASEFQQQTKTIDLDVNALETLKIRARQKPPTTVETRQAGVVFKGQKPVVDDRLLRGLKRAIPRGRRGTASLEPLENIPKGFRRQIEKPFNIKPPSPGKPGIELPGFRVPGGTSLSPFVASGIGSGFRTRPGTDARLNRRTDQSRRPVADQTPGFDLDIRADSSLKRQPGTVPSTTTLTGSTSKTSTFRTSALGLTGAIGGFSTPPSFTDSPPIVPPILPFGSGFPGTSRGRGTGRTSKSRTRFNIGLRAIEGLRAPKRGLPIVRRTPKGGLFGVEVRF